MIPPIMPASARLARPHVLLFLLMTALILSSCAPANQAPVQPQSNATGDAMAQGLRVENAALIQELADAHAKIQEQESALAAMQDQVAALQTELDELKFGAQRLLSQVELALQNQDLTAARRLSSQLAERYPASAEADRAAEVVALLEAAAAERAAAEQARLAEATSKMKSKTDEVRSITFYKDQNTPDYRLDTRIYLYIGRKENQLWMRLYLRYYGDDWLFVDSFTIKAGDQVFEIAPRYDEFQRDNNGYHVWEWYDGAVTNKELQIIRAVIAADEPVLRFNGDKYYSDYVITAAERQALQNVLDAFVAMGGKLTNL